MNRKSIVDRFVTELGSISGVVTVSDNFKMWEDVSIPDMPCLIVVGGTETATYEGKVTVDYDFRVIIYGYIGGANRETQLNNLIQSVRTKIHSDPRSAGLTLDRQIRTIDTDEGMFAPKGVFRMEVSCWVHDIVTSR